MKHALLLACLTWAVTASAQVPSHVPTDGLVGWFPLDGSIVNEVNGAVGNTISTTAEPDRNGLASASLGFNGSAYGVLSNAAMPTGEFSISAWVKQSQSWSTGSGIEFICVGSASNTAWGTIAGTEFIHLNRGRGCSGNGQVLSGVNFPLNEWVHLTYVCGGVGAATEVYLNGDYVGQSLNTTSGSCGSSDLYFGVDVFSAPEYITGGLDDVGIWNRALSDEEVLALYTAAPPISGCTDPDACNYEANATVDDGSCEAPCNYIVPSYIPEVGLIAWLPFNGNAADESGNGHDGDVDGAILSTDRFDNAESAYFFDGDDRIFPADPTDFPLTERTTSIWMKSQVPVSGGRALLGYGGTGCGSSWLLTYNNQGNQPTALNAFEIQGHCNAFAVAAPLSPSEFQEWHQVVVRTSAAGTDIFIDGLLEAHSDTYVNNTGPGCAVIGATPGTTGACYFQDASNALWHGWLDDVGIWNRALTDDEILTSFLAGTPVLGCTDEAACNYDSEANVDDGSCVPSGCMEEGACNYNAAAECEGEACDYSCCPGPGCCGAGTHWDTILATCVVDVPDTVDAACTLMNLQELASGYAALVEQNAALDSLLAACEGDGAAEASGPCAGQNHVTYHGHDYAIVEIGDQCWFAENLQTEAYNNGEPLQSDLNSGAWSTTNEGSYSIYNDEETNSINLGFLFNWHAVADGRGLCPLGWSVANEDAWIALEEYIESNLQADEIGLHLKSTESWTNGNGIDTYGFAAKAAGYRSNDSGEYNYIGNYTYFWSSTPSSSNSAFVRRLDYFSDNLTKYNGNDNLNQGFSVRCVKD
ncbi:hypothetical protein N9C70_03890 [Flavobacteriales bacterium]|nr:hypothetical protein [Flavobacteriales bacterium]MDA9864190.1 hypothetical protein [Flavobacteriales bacterium]